MRQASPSDFDRWETLIAGGQDPSSAARELGFGGSSSFKRADGQRHAEAIEWWRVNVRQDDQEYVRTNLRETHEQARAENDLSAANKSLELLGKQAGMFDDHLEIEHSGGVELVVQHDYAGIARRLAEFGLLGSGVADALDAEAVEVLPARTDDEPGGSPRRAPAQAA